MVVEITILLKRVPKSVKLVHFSVENLDQLTKLIPHLRQLHDHVIIGSGISLYNGLRALSVSTRFPYSLIDNQKEKSSDILNKLVHKNGLRPWMGMFALYGTPKMVNYHIKEIKRTLKPLTNKTMIFSQQFINGLKLLNKLLNSSKINKITHTVQTLLNVVSGIPMRDTLNQVFWRSKQELKITEDTLASDITSHDNGLIWFSPVIPFSESHFTKVHSLVSNILHSYGFECLFGCAGFSSHCLDVTIPIFFNKNDAQEAERALACYDELFNQCLASGYMPYRIGATKMHLLPNTPYDAVNTKLKSILDINKILAPGRYVKEI